MQFSHVTFSKNTLNIIGICAGILFFAILIFNSLLFTQQKTKDNQHIPHFSHVFLIMMENHSYSDIMNNPHAAYTNTLAHEYGLASNYYSVAHPSLPNYLAITGGQTFGVTTDCTNCFIHGPSIFQQIEQKKETWKAYMEDMTENCELSDTNNYVIRHNPAAYYLPIRQSCNENDVPYSMLHTDLQKNTVPTFVWITPNNQHNMHSGTIQQGDDWLKNEVPMILKSSAFKDNGVLFIVWDENDNEFENNHVPLLVISPLGKEHFVSKQQYSHYSLLKTIELGLNLPQLSNAGHAQSLGYFFP